MLPEQRADLKVHVGATAWAAWDGLPIGSRLDLDAALRVYRGDLRQVAAHLLLDLVDQTPAGQIGVERIKVGAIDIKLRDEAGPDPRTTWRTRAERLLQTNERVVSANPAPVLNPWGVS